MTKEELLKRSLILDTECVSGDTLIQTQDGDILEIKDTRASSLWALDQERKVLSFATASSLVLKEQKRCYEVSFKYGLPVTASEKHYFFTNCGWKYTKDLTVEDYVLVSTDFPDSSQEVYTDAQIELLGWFLAEGCRSERCQVVNLAIFEQEYVDVIQNPWPEDIVFKYQPDQGKLKLTSKFSGRKKGGNYFYNKAARFLKECGVLNKYSYEKIIPSNVLRSPKRQIAKLIAAMWSGDGTIVADRLGANYTTTSKRLAEQLVLLLLRFGILSFISHAEDNRKESYKDTYSISVRGDSLLRFAEVIPLQGRKARELTRIISIYTQRIPQSRIPLNLTSGWKEKYLQYFSKLFPSKKRGAFRSLTKHLSCSIHNVIYENVPWPAKALEEAAEVFPEVFSEYVDTSFKSTVWIPVTEVKEIGLQDVYDITTSVNNFFANGVLVHNTLSLEKGQGLHELALFDPESNTIREFFLAAQNNEIKISGMTRQEFTRLSSNQREMYSVVQARNWRDLLEQKLREKGFQWTDEAGFQDAMKRWNLFTYHAYMGSKHRHLQGYTYTEADRQATETLLESKVIRKQNVDLLDLVKKGGELETLMQGKITWVANLKFDAAQLGARMGLLSQQRMEAEIAGVPEALRPSGPMLEDTLQTVPRYSAESLMATGLDYNQARVRAQLTGDWTGVYKAALAPVPAGETATRDIQDLTRAIMSYGKQLGFLNQQDEYLGAQVDLQYRLLHLLEPDQDKALKGFLRGELHQAAADTKWEYYVLKQSLDMLEKLDQLKGMSPLQRQALAMSQEENSDFHRMSRYFGVLNEISPKLQEVSLNERMLRALQDIKEQGFTSQVVGSTIQRRTNLEQATGQEIEIPIMGHQRQEMGFDQFTQFLKRSKYFHGIDIDAQVTKLRDFVEVNGTVDPDKMIEFQKTQTRKLVEAEFAPGGAGEALFNRGVSRTSTAEKMLWGAASSVQEKLGKFSKGSMAGAAVGILAATATLSLLPDQDTEYQSLTHQGYDQWFKQQEITGMSEQGIAGMTRKQNTDFGSPYKGPEASAAVLADQELLQEREKWLRQQYGIVHSPSQGLFSAVGAFKRLNLRRQGYSFLTGEKYTGTGFKGNLRQVDLSGYKVSAEDADTVTIQRGGLRGFIGGILGLNTRYNVRLVGIDSPETSHGMDNYHAPQPGAEDSGAALQFMLANTKNLSLVIDPSQTTYGRMLGAVVGDGKVLNYELVKQGKAAYLPYGSPRKAMVDYDRLKRMDTLAHGSRMGIWKTPWAMAYYDGMEGAGDRMTFNTLVKKDRIVESGSTMSLLTMMETAQNQGMYNNAMSIEMSKIGKHLKQEQFKPDYSDPYILPHNVTPTDSYRTQQARELAGYMRTHGTNRNPNMFQVRSTMKLDSYMALDSMSSTNSVWSKRRMGTFKVYGVDKTSMAEAQRDVNQSIFASGIGHTVW